MLHAIYRLAGGGRRGTSGTETKILRGRRNEGSREKKEEGKRERGIEADCKSSGNEAPSSRGLTDLFDVHGPTYLPTYLPACLPTYLHTYLPTVRMCTCTCTASNNAHMQKAHHRPPSLFACISSFLFSSFVHLRPLLLRHLHLLLRHNSGPPMRAGPRGVSKRIISTTNDFSRGKTCY